MLIRIIIDLLVLCGLIFAAAGAAGILKMPDLFSRMQAATCISTLGVLGVVLGGVLFADNVLYRGYVGKDKKAPHRHATIKHSIENFLDRVTKDKRLKTVVYEIEDGVSVTEKLYE